MSPRITAMGDSITAAGWPGMLGALLETDVMNRGCNGALTADGLEDIAAVLAYDQPDVLLVAYGLNDVACRLPPECILHNLQVLARLAGAKGARPMVATLTPVFPPFESLAADARRVSEEIRDWGRADRIPVADVEAAFRGDRSLISADGIHPTRAGLETIARVFRDTLAG